MNVFISYRRDDSSYVTDRIYGFLSQRLGRRNVFRDIDSIPPGMDFVSHINESIAKCDVFLAVMGSRWLESTDAAGGLRIHDQQDFVRLEIESALQTSIPVIPLLVEGCAMPEPSSLPASIQSLTGRQAHQIRRDPDFEIDMQRLVAYLRSLDREVVSNDNDLDFGDLGLM